MKTISPDTRKLIDHLNRPARLLERLTGLRDDEEVLFEIGVSAEPAAIIDILPFVLANSKEVAGTAARAIHKLAGVASPADLAWLDSVWRERSQYYGTHRSDWHRMSPTKLSFLESFGDASTTLLGMASFHESGYVREEAVKRLDLITSGAEVPFLIIRLNDWVANVRDAAYSAIQLRVKPQYCRSFIASLALISRLEQTERGDNRPIIQAINELLKSSDSRPQLLEAFHSTDRFIRRISFRLLILSSAPDLPELLRQGLGDNDTVIRLSSAQRASSALEGPALDQMLTLMRRDRFMPVRREAFRIRVSRAVDLGRGEFLAALLDTHPSIREEARYGLRQLESVDFASFYRQALEAEDESNLYSAISGLGETGSAEDCDPLIPYASHDAAKIRKA